MEYFLKCGEQYAIDAETAKGRTMLTREEADSLLDESKNALVEMLCNMSHQIDMLNDKLTANDEEIERMKAIIEEAIKKPMGVEPHSWSDYKMEKSKCMLINIKG